MKRNKISKLFLLTPIALSASVCPMLITACSKKNSDSSTKTIVSVDKNLSYQYFSTFKVNKADRNDKGYWKIFIDDIEYDINSKTNEYFSVPSITDTELILQPINCNKISSSEINTKYQVSYFNSKNECIYTTASILDSQNKIDIKIIGPQYFSHAKPTVSFEAYDASTGNDLTNIEWSYQLMDKSVQSYLRYFSVIEEGPKTTLTLIKNDIPTQTSIWVSVSDGQTKASRRLTIVNYLPPKIDVNAGSHTKLNLNQKASFSIDFKSGSTALQNFAAGWNIYTASGQPINTNDKGEQIPITSDTFDEQSPKYSKDLLNKVRFLSPEVSRGQKGVKDEQLSLTLNPEAYIPSYSGIKLEAIILFEFPQEEGKEVIKEVVSVSEPKSINYDNRNYSLDIQGQVSLCDVGDSADVAELSFICTPYRDRKMYKYTIETVGDEQHKIKIPDSHEQFKEYTTAAKFTGYRDVVNEKGGKRGVDTLYNKSDFDDSRISPAQALLRFNKPNDPYEEDCVNPNDALIYDESSGYWKINVKLFKELFLPVQDETGQQPEIRDIDFAFTVNIKDLKDNYITSFPVSINLLNKNRVLSSKKFVTELDSEGTKVLNLHQFEDQALHDTTKEFWQTIEPYQCELYIATDIEKIMRSTFDTTSSVDIKEQNDLTKVLRYVSFAYNSKFTTLVDANGTDVQGVFEFLTNFRKIDFSNCKNIKRIGSFAFDHVGEASSRDTLSSITIPVQNQNSDPIYIGESAFADCGNLRSVTFERGDSGFNKNLEIEKSAFINCGELYKFEALYSITDKVHNIKVKENAFENCVNLSLFDFSKVVQISSFSFWNCQKLTNLNFSSNYDSILFYDGTTDDKKNVITTDAKAVFGYSNTGKAAIDNPVVTLNIQFAGNEETIKMPVKSETSEVYTINELYKTLPAESADSKVVSVNIGNFSGTYNVYKSQKEKTNTNKFSFAPRKLDLYNAGEETEGITIASTVEELSFSNATDDWATMPLSTFIQVEDAKNSKLRILTFNKVGISSNIAGKEDENGKFPLFKAAEGETSAFDINNIETFVLIAPTIKTDTNETKLDYTDKILSHFFPTNVHSTSPKRDYSTWLSNYNIKKILNINIKLSLGPDAKEDPSLDDQTTYGQLKYQILTCYRLASWNGSAYIDRGTLPSIDLNTHITWILW